VNTLELQDSMPSFFLAETLKYLYLLFDENHAIFDSASIFSTEAHPIDLVHIHALNYNRDGGSEIQFDSQRSVKRKTVKRVDEGTVDESVTSTVPGIAHNKKVRPELNSQVKLAKLCAKSKWWDRPTPFHDISTSSTVSHTVLSGRRSTKATAVAKTSSQLKRRIERQRRSSLSIFRLLAFSEPNIAVKAVSKCKLADAPTATPSLSPSNPPPSLTPANQQVLKRVELNMGPLGNFHIDALMDGFRIQNDADGRELVVTNIGTKSVFAQERRHESETTKELEMTGISVGVQRVSIGLSFGASSHCSVSLYANESRGDVFTSNLLWKRYV
jgi:hypothetical protein